MKQSSLVVWLKVITIIIGIIGAVTYFLVVPFVAREILSIAPEFMYCYWPDVILVWITAIPCYAALVLFWQICTQIGKDNSFCEGNAKRLKNISFLAIADAIYFFLANAVLLALNMTSFRLFILSLLVEFVGIAIGIAAAALSHLVYKAGELQEENKLTI